MTVVDQNLTCIRIGTLDTSRRSYLFWISVPVCFMLRWSWIQLQLNVQYVSKKRKFHTAFCTSQMYSNIVFNACTKNKPEDKVMTSVMRSLRVKFLSCILSHLETKLNCYSWYSERNFLTLSSKFTTHILWCRVISHTIPSKLSISEQKHEIVHTNRTLYSACYKLIFDSAARMLRSSAMSVLTAWTHRFVCACVWSIN